MSVPANTYRVRLDAFEGPLDLLLHLVKTNEVDIYRLPIAVITDQYLEYLGMFEELDLDSIDAATLALPLAMAP